MALLLVTVGGYTTNSSSNRRTLVRSLVWAGLVCTQRQLSDDNNETDKRRKGSECVCVRERFATYKKTHLRPSASNVILFTVSKPVTTYDDAVVMSISIFFSKPPRSLPVISLVLSFPYTVPSVCLSLAEHSSFQCAAICTLFKYCTYIRPIHACMHPSQLWHVVPYRYWHRASSGTQRIY